MSGISDPIDPPEKPDIQIEATPESIDQATEQWEGYRDEVLDYNSKVDARNQEVIEKNDQTLKDLRSAVG